VKWRADRFGSPACQGAHAHAVSRTIRSAEDAAANTLSGAGASSVVGEKDTLTGGGADLFLLGNSKGRFYNNGNRSTPGIGDYVQVTDFHAAEGDRLQLKGTAGEYLIGTNPVAGIAGQGVFFDSDSSGTQTANDELIAAVNASSPLNLATQAQFVA
jgi:hypothetical protein